MTYPLINEDFVALQETADIPENLVYTTIDKFQLRQGPVDQAPHKCASCGNPIITKEQWYVDWLFTLDYYGQVIFCVDCVRQMANQLGYMDPKQVRELVMAGSAVTAQNMQLLEENKRLRDALAALGLVTSNPVLDNSDLVSVEEPRQEDEPDPVEQPVNDPEPDEAESGTVQQDASERPSSLSGDDTLDQLLGDSI